jgi:hypothetical protein
MWRRRSVLAAIIVLLSLASAAAQERSRTIALNAAIDSQRVQFSVVRGHITLQGLQIGPLETGPNTPNRKDHVSLRAENGDISLNYEWLNAKERFTIDACGNSRLSVRREPLNVPQATTVEFEQLPRGKSTLTIACDGDQQVYAAEGLWRLFLLYPEPARKHLAPLLQPLQPNWKLADAAESVEAELLRTAEKGILIDRSRWGRWVAELGDERFARREAADRALRAADPALLLYLERLDSSRLDAEQQFRLRRIWETLSAKISGDTPEQIASWLGGDTAVWLALLTRPDVAVRRTAAKQLAGMLSAPIPVDPEADPASQQSKLEELRARLEASDEQK